MSLKTQLSPPEDELLFDAVMYTRLGYNKVKMKTFLHLYTFPSYSVHRDLWLFLRHKQRDHQGA
jgi:hypothetical protein